jgi:hypothetical protein
VKKFLAAIAVLSLAGGAPAAIAHKGKDKGKHHAYVFKAKLQPVVYGADQAYSGMEGKAQMVDNRRNDKVSIHMKGLAPKTTYPWHVHVIEDAPAGTNPCKAGAAQGPIVTEFKYKPLKANKAGRANSKGSSKTFRTDANDLYYVNVHDPATGAPISCGILKPTKKTKPKLKKLAKKQAAAKNKGKGHDKAKGKGHGKGHTEPA